MYNKGAQSAHDSVKMRWTVLLACVVGGGLLCSVMGAVYATLDLELTQGVKGRIPVAITHVVISDSHDKGRLLEAKQWAEIITRIVRRDLSHSTALTLISPKQDVLPVPSPRDSAKYHAFWRHQGADFLVLQRVSQQAAGRLSIRIQLLDLYAQKGCTHSSINRQAADRPHAQGNCRAGSGILFDKTFTVKQVGLRHFSHFLSDRVYRKLVGRNSFYASRLAYVLVKPSRCDMKNRDEAGCRGRKKYLLQIADVDGQGARTILNSYAPIMSPAWSPDGQSIAYVSFEFNRAAIFIENVKTGERRKVVHFPGINGAPAWSPDGTHLALVLSKTGEPKLYDLNLKTRVLRQLTWGNAIDTEPVWMPDGKQIIFTSNRGGSPQIHMLTLATKAVKRLTYAGDYNARPSLSADGHYMAFLHKESNWFAIAIRDMTTGEEKVISEAGRQDSPVISPNGSIVLYAVQNNIARGMLEMLSRDGALRWRLPVRIMGSLQSPAWSPS